MYQNRGQCIYLVTVRVLELDPELVVHILHKSIDNYHGLVDFDFDMSSENGYILMWANYLCKL